MQGYCPDFLYFCLFLPKSVYRTFSGRNSLQAFRCMDITFHSLHQCWLPLFPNAQATGWNISYFLSVRETPVSRVLSPHQFVWGRNCIFLFLVCHAEICNHFTKAEDQNCCDYANSFWILSFSWDGMLGTCPSVTSKQSQTYGFVWHAETVLSLVFAFCRLCTGCRHLVGFFCLSLSPF